MEKTFTFATYTADIIEQTHCPVCHEPLTEPTPAPCEWCNVVINFACAGDLERGICRDCLDGDD